jgi:hypothetical protein
VVALKNSACGAPYMLTRPKGKNRDEKKPVLEIAGTLWFEFLVAKSSSHILSLQNFSPAAAISCLRRSPRPKGTRRAENKSI